MSGVQREAPMPDTIRQADYYYTMVPDKPGEGAKVLGLLRAAGVNLLAFSAFPSARKSQADFVPADAAAFVAAAKAAKVKLKGPKKCFLIEGDDRPGAPAGVGRERDDAPLVQAERQLPLRPVPRRDGALQRVARRVQHPVLGVGHVAVVGEQRHHGGRVPPVHHLREQRGLLRDGVGDGGPRRLVRGGASRGRRRTTSSRR